MLATNVKYNSQIRYSKYLKSVKNEEIEHEEITEEISKSIFSNSNSKQLIINLEEIKSLENALILQERLKEALEEEKIYTIFHDKDDQNAKEHIHIIGDYDKNINSQTLYKIANDFIKYLNAEEVKNNMKTIRIFDNSNKNAYALEEAQRAELLKNDKFSFIKKNVKEGKIENLENYEKEGSKNATGLGKLDRPSYILNDIHNPKAKLISRFGIGFFTDSEFEINNDDVINSIKELLEYQMGQELDENFDKYLNLDIEQNETEVSINFNNIVLLKNGYKASVAKNLIEEGLSYILRKSIKDKDLVIENEDRLKPKDKVLDELAYLRPVIENKEELSKLDEMIVNHAEETEAKEADVIEVIKDNKKEEFAKEVAKEEVKETKEDLDFLSNLRGRYLNDEEFDLEAEILDLESQNKVILASLTVSSLAGSVTATQAMKDVIKDNENKISLIKTEVKKIQEEEKKKAENERLRALIDEMVDEKLALSNSLGKEIEEKKEVLEKYEKSEKTNEDLVKSIAKELEEKEELREELHASKEEAEAYADLLEKEEVRTKDLTNKLNEATAENKTLTETLNKEKADKEEANNKVIKLEADAKELVKEKEALALEKEQLLKDKARLEEQLSNKDEELQVSNSLVEKLKAELESVKEEMKATVERITTEARENINKVKEESKKFIEELKESLAVFKTENETLSKSADNSKVELEKYKTENENSKSENIKLRAELEQEKAKAKEESKKSNEAKEANSKELQEAKEALKEQIAINAKNEVKLKSADGYIAELREALEQTIEEEEQEQEETKKSNKKGNKGHKPS